MGKLSLTGTILAQLQRVGPVTTVDLTGKTVMVVGANTGLGFEASKHFAKMNPTRLILACRNKDKGEAALQRLRRETDYKGGELALVDLNSFASVTAFATKFEEDGGRLDILVLNAAIATPRYSTTQDGWESTLQVNCLSLFLIALRLLPSMTETGDKHGTNPRLVLVSSGVHFLSSIPAQKQLISSETGIYETLSSEEYCTPAAMVKRYTDSKFLDILFFCALTNHLSPNSHLIVTSVDPGFCYSEIRRDATWSRAIIFWFMEKILARTAEEGGRQLIYAALGGMNEGKEAEEKFRGAYIANLRIDEPSDFVLGEEGKILGERLWDEVVHILGKVDEKVRVVVDGLRAAS